MPCDAQVSVGLLPPAGSEGWRQDQNLTRERSPTLCSTVCDSSGQKKGRMPGKFYKIQTNIGAVGWVLRINQHTRLWKSFSLRWEKTIRITHFADFLEKTVIELSNDPTCCCAVKKALRTEVIFQVLVKLLPGVNFLFGKQEINLDDCKSLLQCETFLFLI